MIKRFIWAVIKLARKFLEELLKGWFKRKLLTVMMYIAGIMTVAFIIALLAATL